MQVSKITGSWLRYVPRTFMLYRFAFIEGREGSGGVLPFNPLKFDEESSDGRVLGGVVDSKVELRVEEDLLVGTWPLGDSLDLLEDLSVRKLDRDLRRLLRKEGMVREYDRRRGGRECRGKLEGRAVKNIEPNNRSRAA